MLLTYRIINCYNFSSFFEPLHAQAYGFSEANNVSPIMRRGAIEVRAKKLKLKFHRGIDPGTGEERVEAYFRPQHLTSVKRIKIETVFIPDPDWHDVELGKEYVCTTHRTIYRQDNGCLRAHIISVRPARELPPLSENEMTPLVLRFHTRKDRRSQEWRSRHGIRKKQKYSFVRSNGVATKYVVDQRDPLQPQEAEQWQCRPIQLLHRSEDSSFQMIRVQLIQKESVASPSMSGELS